MYSSNDKLIDEVKQRLLSFKKKNYNNYNENGSNIIESRRISTLIPRRSSRSKRTTIKLKTNRNFLTEDKINLRLVPVIKSVKAIIRFRKDSNNNYKIYTTEDNDELNCSRNKYNLKKPKVNSNSNIYITTFSNVLSTSNSFGKFRTVSKRQLFMSPFQVGKNKKKIFKNLVNLSKELHSPKNKEHNLIKNIFNISSFKRLNELQSKKNKNKKKKKDNIGVSPIKFTLKTIKNENSFFHDNQKEKINKNKNINKKNKIKFLLQELNNGNETLKRIMKNNEKKIRPNCYYNKLHLNKIHDIIEKYSYNNKD